MAEPYHPSAASFVRQFLGNRFYLPQDHLANILNEVILAVPGEIPWNFSWHG
jgi:hypothetical protein